MFGRINTYYMAPTGSFVKSPATYSAITQSLYYESFDAQQSFAFNLSFAGKHVDVIPPPPPPEFNLEPTRYRKVYSHVHDYPLKGRTGFDPLFLEWFPKRWLFLWGHVGPLYWPHPPGDIVFSHNQYTTVTSASLP